MRRLYVCQVNASRKAAAASLGPWPLKSECREPLREINFVL